MITSEKLPSRNRDADRGPYDTASDAVPWANPVRLGEMIVVQHISSSTSLQSGTERWSSFVLGRAEGVTRDGLVRAYAAVPGGRAYTIDPPGVGVLTLSERYQGAAADLFGATERGKLPPSWPGPDELRAALVEALTHRNMAPAGGSGVAL